MADEVEGSVENKMAGLEIGTQRGTSEMDPLNKAKNKKSSKRLSSNNLQR